LATRVAQEGTTAELSTKKNGGSKTQVRTENTKKREKIRHQRTAEKKRNPREANVVGETGERVGKLV